MTTCPKQDNFLFHAQTKDDISENISDIIDMQYLNIPTQALPPLHRKIRESKVNQTRSHLIEGLERRRELIRILEKPVHAPD